MEMQELLGEINALAKKKKPEGLTEAEQKRQKELYAIYLKGFREQVKERLDNVDVTYRPKNREEKKFHSYPFKPDPS